MEFLYACAFKDELLKQ